MFGHICMQVKENCWNFWDSYGEICVHCGCCSEDPAVRARARLEVCERELTEWEASLEEMKKDATVYEEYQIENVKSNIRHVRRRIRYYRKRVKEIDSHR